ncbi:LacI family DNA-binding transcriptional regulator [Sinomonas susongensis]|uniref:LacI family DNA-binding transcriptional regulator n=1 Tax=Sinomonas susongensis TaxID=1324851 RepID=UPI001FE95150|nr:LacI family DNA-binding transcriptional regulator [Sinomonas susongensis]
MTLPPPGPRRPVTQEDIAREVGVSRTLVSFAFRGAPGVSSETRQAILEAARRLGYRQNAAAADLARKRPSAIGLYLLDLRNEVYADIFHGVREALGDAPNRLILSVSPTANSLGRRAIDSLIEARVGIVIAATLLDSDSEIRDLAQTVPVVNVARRVEGIDSVYSDDPAGADTAVRHLVELGHTRIAHLTGPPHEGHQGRRRAYERTMAAAGLPSRVVTADDYTQEAAEKAVRRLLSGSDRPTAVFAHNDELAVGAREAAYSLGLAVPDDLSLVGYDNSRIARLHGVDLTSIDLHALDLGRSAGRVALDRLADPLAHAVDLKSDPRLVVRSSSAPPPLPGGKHQEERP